MFVFFTLYGKHLFKSFAIKITGIKQSTLRQYINGNDPVQDVVKSIHKAYVQKTVSKTQKVDDFDKGVVRRTIYDLHKKSQSVTMPKLQEAKT